MGGKQALRILAYAVCVAAGCSSGDDAPAEYMGGPVSQHDLPSLGANALCSALQPCCEQAGVGFDRQTCQFTFGAALSQGLSEADPAHYSYDPDAAGTCLGAIQDIASLCSDESAMSFDMQSGFCENAFEGTLEPGEPCHSSVECARPSDGSSECYEPFDSSEATCVVKPTAAAGEPCYWTCVERGSTLTCYATNVGPDEPAEQPRCYTNDGLYCAQSGLCEVAAEEGGDCDRDEGCVEGLYCASGTCAELLGEGDPCDFEGCDEGLYCKQGQCAQELAPGAACDELEDECENGYCDGGTCVEGGAFDDLSLLFCGFGGGT